MMKLNCATGSELANARRFFLHKMVAQFATRTDEKYHAARLTFRQGIGSVWGLPGSGSDYREKKRIRIRSSKKNTDPDPM